MKTYIAYQGDLGVSANVEHLNYKYNGAGFRSGILYTRDLNTTVGAHAFIGAHWTIDGQYPSANTTNVSAKGKLNASAYYLCHIDRLYSDKTSIPALKWSDIKDGKFGFMRQGLISLGVSCDCTFNYVKSNDDGINNGKQYIRNTDFGSDFITTDVSADAKKVLSTISIKSGSITEHIVYALAENRYVDFRAKPSNAIYKGPVYTDFSASGFSTSRITDETGLFSTGGMKLSIAAWLGNARFITTSGHYVTFTDSGSSASDIRIFYVHASPTITLNESNEEHISIGSVISLPETLTIIRNCPLEPRIIFVNGTKIVANRSIPYTRLLYSSSFMKDVTYQYNSTSITRSGTYISSDWIEIAVVDECIPDRLLLSSQGTHVIFCNMYKPELITVDVLAKDIDLRLSLNDSINMLDFEQASIGLFATSTEAKRLYKNVLKLNGFIENNELISISSRISRLEESIEIMKNK